MREGNKTEIPGSASGAQEHRTLILAHRRQRQRQRQADLCEFEVSLIYIVSSRPTGTHNEILSLNIYIKLLKGC